MSMSCSSEHYHHHPHDQEYWQEKAIKSTYCVVELAQSIGPAGSETAVGDSGIAPVQVVEPVSCNLICLVTIGYIVQMVEPGAQLLVYSQLKIVEGFLAMRKFGGLF